MSSADKSTGAAAPKALTERDTQILAHAWTCMESDPEINYEVLATKIGKNDGTAAYKALWRIKKKLAQHSDSVPATPKKGANKRAAATAGDGDDDDAETPSKKRKTPTKSRAKKGAAKAASGGDDEEVDEMDDDDAAAV